MKFVITAHEILYFQEWLKIKIEKFSIMANSLKLFLIFALCKEKIENAYKQERFTHFNIRESRII